VNHMLKRWYTILETGNLPPGERPGPGLDWLSRWLLITRFCVMPMTLYAALLALLLALWQGYAVDWSAWCLAAIGLVLAHITNNMLNDWLDWRQGVDTKGYPRTEYSPHPLLSGLTTEGRLLAAILLCLALDAAIGAYLWWLRGWPIVAFALAGFALSTFYVAPPLHLKRHGLGELTVLVVWGPLMVGGTFYAVVGSLPAWVVWASLPYGLLVTTVLLGKHIDKYEYDLAKDVHTLPVLLGPRVARLLTRWALAAFFILVALEVWRGILPVTCLLVALALPRLHVVDQFFRRPRPYSRPPDDPIWPLWFAALAFLVVRLAGAWFLLGLLLAHWLPFSL